MADETPDTPDNDESQAPEESAVATETFESVEIEDELQKSYIDYAMSVIVGRALPDSRDGLKPVHRRILFSMWEGGMRAGTQHRKSAAAVGDVMKKYHPHGDSSIYDALVRMAQPWAIRYPLIEGHGNFGSIDGDPPAAMRYCVTGDTRVRLADGTHRRIDSLAGDRRGADLPVDLKLQNHAGDPVRATRWFDSGVQTVLRLETREGLTLSATPNHPVLVAAKPLGVAVHQWRLMSELKPGDRVAIRPNENGRVEQSDGSEVGVDDDGWTSSWLASGGEVATPKEQLGLTGKDALGLQHAEVVSIVESGAAPVYSVRVDSDDHAFITDGFVSHNTEARLSPLAMELLRDIEEETVDWQDNYDGQEEEPLVLPSRFPNLLVNGSAGIAVGMATNVPPHNLVEVTNAVIAQMHDPDVSLDDLMQIIPGPDFPTGALIMGADPIRQAYETGRGSIRMRAVVDVEENKLGEQLVVTELPYQVNKANLALKIAELVNTKRILGIRDIRDESNRKGIRLVIELKRDANAQVVLNQLYKSTQLQDTFGVINLSLVPTGEDSISPGVPRTMGLKDTIARYITHQINIIRRRTEYRLRKARERAHIIEGLIIALDNLDEVIQLIRNSASADAALNELMSRFDLSERQAKAILDLPLRRLAALERQRIQDEYAELMLRITELEGILADPEKVKSIIIEELQEISDRFGDPRRTKIVPAEGDLGIEDLIAEEEVVVTITQAGYIKRVAASEYRVQRRGGQGINAGGLKDSDIVWDLFSTSTHHWVLFFTSKGRMHRIKTWQIPEKSRTARGVYMANVPGLVLEKDEIVRTVVHLDSMQQEGDKHLLFTTKRGIVKRTKLEEYDSPRSTLIAINLRDGDELIDVRLTNGDDDVILVSEKGQSIRFHETDARAMGRSASGVKGMSMRPEDRVLACAIVQPDGYLVVITDEGFGKRTPLERYPAQKRGGMGVKTAKLTDNRGGLVGALVAAYEQEIFIVTDKGTIIRMDVKDVRPTGRNTQGVRVMTPKEGAKVASVAKVMELSEDEDDLDGEASDIEAPEVPGVPPGTGEGAVDDSEIVEESDDREESGEEE